jgi:hypothetical protein
MFVKEGAKVDSKFDMGPIIDKTFTSPHVDISDCYWFSGKDRELINFKIPEMELRF